MNIIQTPIKDLVILEPRVFEDDRGYFFESYNDKVFRELTGYTGQFVQDNQARSVKNVLRGLHYQNAPTPQSKLVRALEGAIWDVAVDIRKNSPTYGQWFGVELSAQNKRQLFVPRGFAHGYSVLSDFSEIMYKCDNLYNKSAEGGIRFDDAAIGIDWKIDLSQAIVSEKDVVQPVFGAARIEF